MSPVGLNNRVKMLVVSSGDDSEEVSLADTPEVQKTARLLSFIG